MIYEIFYFRALLLHESCCMSHACTEKEFECKNCRRNSIRMYYFIGSPIVSIVGVLYFYECVDPAKKIAQQDKFAR